MYFELLQYYTPHPPDYAKQLMSRTHWGGSCAGQTLLTHTVVVLFAVSLELLRVVLFLAFSGLLTVAACTVTVAAEVSFTTA